MAHPIGTHFNASPAGGVEAITASKTLTADDHGKVFMWNVLTGATVTLPPVANADGMQVKFIIKLACTSNTYIITETTASDTDVLISQVNELETDTDTDGPSSTGHTTYTIGTTGTVGDYVDAVCDGAKWYLHGQAKLDGAHVLA